MDDTTKEIAAGVIRHGLTMLGGVLVTDGYMQSSQTAAFVGGGMALVGVAWSWWQKDGKAKFVATLARMHPISVPAGATQEQVVKAATVAVATEEKKA